MEVPIKDAVVVTAIIICTKAHIAFHAQTIIQAVVHVVLILWDNLIVLLVRPTIQ